VSTRTLIGEASVPRLGPHVKLRLDKQRDQWIVLAPERLFVPDAVALEIIRRCDGAATVTAIVDALAEAYKAPREVILRDVSMLLQDLADKGIMTG